MRIFPDQAAFRAADIPPKPVKGSTGLAGPDPTMKTWEGVLRQVYSTHGGMTLPGRGGRAMEATMGAEGKMMNRWWRVAGALLMNLPLGALYAWSIFVLPLEKEFGWTRTQTSWVFTIAVFVFGLSFIAAGRPAGQEGAVLDLGHGIGPVQPRVGPRDLREGPVFPVSHDGSRVGDRQRVRVCHADPGPVEVVSRPAGGWRWDSPWRGTAADPSSSPSSASRCSPRTDGGTRSCTWGSGTSSRR